ncbi:TIGR03915 family putative DNA repair protein [Desulfonatronum lacustre]|uniref:TIGR03915 family putative DNA repair protein n=1 Tax=Desulfonatronum lacustre TaxID=66849 RepID=UPI0004B50BC3|nr:TIGR03915 family putative DNA repair protein [Desulfonatronum lacustre]
MDQIPRIFSYDGSFDGLLCAFAAADGEGLERCGFVVEGGGRPGLWPPTRVAVHAETAARFLERLRRSGGEGAVQHLVYVFLAEVQGAEPELYEFARLTLQAGTSVLGMRTNAAVRRVMDWKAKVGKEAHRCTGLLRFMELRDATLYARFEPDHNVLPLVAPHFQRRFPQDNWVIHDLRRGLALAWDGQELHPVVGVPENVDALLSRRETTFQELWREYVQALAVPERRNPALQRRFMPRRYWKHLVERPN